jgi:hypothetical protein
MRDEHYRTQNSTEIVQPRGNVNGIIFCANLCCTKHLCATWLIVNGQSCIAQNIFAQHDWSWMGKLVLHKTFLRNMIDREWSKLCCTKHFCATWLIVNGQSCVAQNIFAQHDWSWMGPFIREVPLSNLGRQTGYIDWGFYWFSSVPPKKMSG